MKVIFEHNYQQKYLEMSFDGETTIREPEDVMEWRQQWLSALSSWHSPYKAIIDCQNLRIDPDANRGDIRDSIDRMNKLLSGFFLKKAVIFGIETKDQEVFPFQCVENREEAYQKAGIRQSTTKTNTDFRSQISLQNHFQQHVMELSFESPVSIDSKEKIMALRSKITNNLMQWHSSWSLLVDCNNVDFSLDMSDDFQGMVRFFKGFFLKEVLGYSPMSKDIVYPFKVYRSRHNAAGRLESEGNFSGDDANCQSRK